ncbi:uncharacterized protein LOC122391906 [Amphibalanus amphitrite]|uniref:uncharacterized protein LOC122391906 n=1 Tax=Amphibalanus amphitrite TaxID=1232801 RepID=UPI001C90260C|nr:uncharacterized protein LOC122391906 [Amphibalanus amphitrite]XP_043242188.1 uncharacterized protein LOC122391906 [Amphibalanus amphitrite]
MSGRGCGVVSCYHEHVSRLSVTFGAVTLALVTLCVATDRWVTTTEGSPVTSEPAASSDVTRFRIGLLRICRLADQEGDGSNSSDSEDCSWIDYLNTDRLTSVDIKSIHLVAVFTVSVVDRIRRIAPVLALCLTVAVVGCVLSIVGHCRKSRCTIAAAGMFVLAGLLLGSAQVAMMNMLSDEFLVRPLRSGGATSYKMGACFYGAAAAILVAQLAALMSAHAFLRRVRSPVDLLKRAPTRPPELFVGTHKLDLAAESPLAPVVGHSRTLPSRGRYAKQVTFDLDEPRPLVENNGGVAGGHVRSLCDLHRADDRFDCSRV